MNSKITIAVVIAFAAGFALHAAISGGGSQPSSTAGHWKVVNEYNAFIHDPSNLESDSQSGLSYFTPPTDPLPSLAALVAVGELKHKDIVLPEVPKSRETNQFWMRFCENREDIVYALGKRSHVAGKPSGVEPLHLNLWFKRSAEADVKLLIAQLEEFARGELDLNQASRVTRESENRVVPPSPHRDRFIGEWQSEGNTVYVISSQPGGSVTIESGDVSDWVSVVNNVHWEKDVLHFDEYMYYTGQVEIKWPHKPVGDHPFSGVRITSTLSLMSDPDRLRKTILVKDTPQPIVGELERARVDK